MRSDSSTAIPKDSIIGCHPQMLCHRSANPISISRRFYCAYAFIVRIVHYEIYHLARLNSDRLRRDHLSLLKEQPGLMNHKDVLFLHDNTMPHVAYLPPDTIQTLGWELLLHPPYTLDISPSDCRLLLNLDNHLRNR
ncbi:Histone-lysine N-methyltransferase SETMAR like protein [Argiope bruennichi]|uniref:Histone-lysine N-methyltransferase SETMAR like protein n=1 Tax=Argiope bruennichi TaxID=94029 RepID=A0A8T0EU85_ARGBR|nr:Histone-lysine N-methyltransferase SETMAR like protein [Argiope bruennichi]